MKNKFLIVYCLFLLTACITTEEIPMYPGGEAKMHSFFRNTLRYPKSAQEKGIEGRVVVQFIVTSTGEISDVKVLNGIDYACDKEAVRVIKMMPKWIPAKHKGRNVPVHFRIPIVFRLH